MNRPEVPSRCNSRLKLSLLGKAAINPESRRQIPTDFQSKLDEVAGEAPEADAILEVAVAAVLSPL